MIFAVELVLRDGADGAPRGLREHRAYWDGLAEEGVLIAGGPWQDGSGELLLCRAPDRAAVLRLLDQDPYLRLRTVTRFAVRAWQPTGELPAPAAPAARPAAPAGPLTPHEERVAAMAVEGMTNRAIAASLSVSTRAVELQMTRIYRKLDIRRRAQLAPALNGLGSSGALPAQST
ncbi:LuxR C-terminal-related transcriptional regulator [Kitasatospora phosalacinea]|uniref:LuxR C-terminal-related transcriptional regulator n=1 Tax=Kitasatospora phosalacinea TaxID=2065 RepID=UPI00052776CB|nr:LuxR C-terminal-related transcriptional regulator [Kitasatospora phosalacinea]